MQSAHTKTAQVFCTTTSFIPGLFARKCVQNQTKCRAADRVRFRILEIVFSELQKKFYFKNLNEISQCFDSTSELLNLKHTFSDALNAFEYSYLMATSNRIEARTRSADLIEMKLLNCKASPQTFSGHFFRKNFRLKKL